MKTVAKFKPIWRCYTWLQFCCCLSLITYLSLKPDPGDMFVSLWDKALHVFGWFVVGGALTAAWGYRRYFTVAIIALWCYSALIEVLQEFTGRQFSGMDMLANALGIGLAVAVFLALKHLWPQWLLELLSPNAT